MKLTLGISPCPNDTFIFDALAHGALDDALAHGALGGALGDGALDEAGGGEPLTVDVVLEDVQTLNEWALAGRLDVTKLSYGVLPRVSREYALLSSGGALGRGVGPLLVARPGVAFDPATARVAIPGRDTTAHLLFSLAYPEATRKEFLVFSEVEDAVLGGAVDAGVLIHEGRFTYEAKGLARVADLGELWERRTGVPIPLGGIVARRNLGRPVLQRLERMVRESVLRARAAWPRLPAWVREHAQEMDESVMRRHVELYVNDFSVDLGDDGRAAVRTFLAAWARANPGLPAPGDPFV